MRHTLPALLAAALTTACGTTPTTTRAEPAPATSSPVTAFPDEHQPYTPEPSEFTIGIRILKKTCFGSAGCNVTFRIKPSYNGIPLPDDQELTVTYEVRGGEDPKVNSFTMVGTEAEFDAEEHTSTPSSRSKLRARVTDVF